MAGFNTVDSVVNSLSVLGQGQYLEFNKTLPSTTAAGVPHSLWEATGFPSASNGQGASASGSFICSATMAGAIPFNNAVSLTSASLISWECTPTAAAGVGTLLLIDRIAQFTMNHNANSAVVTGMDATSRLASNEGAMIWVEVASALSAGSNTFTLTYTNQAGQSKTTQSIVTVASAIRGRSATANLWVPLASGDSGARTITNFNFVAGSATGVITICLVRVLARLPQNTAGVSVARDFVVEIPNLRKVYDNSCLSFIFIPNAAGTPQWAGAITIACN